jgi:hypothetical protein
MRWSAAGTTDAAREDFELVRELGIRFLRYGVPLHRTYPAPGRFDWSFTDQPFSALRGMDSVPVVDLCHFASRTGSATSRTPRFASLLFVSFCPSCPLTSPLADVRVIQGWAPLTVSRVHGSVP